MALTLVSATTSMIHLSPVQIALVNDKRVNAQFGSKE
jgi:hypothetical protein